MSDETSSRLAALVANHWSLLAARERMLVRGAAAAVVLALFWWLGLAPALRILRTATETSLALEAQLQQMLVLQGEAQSLRARPAMNRDQILQALQTSVTRTLGAGAKLQVNDDNATLVVKAVPASALIQWLGEARESARVRPTQARIQRTPGQAATALPATWDGTFLLALPADL